MKHRYALLGAIAIGLMVAVIADLHDRGRHVLCYVDAGPWEPYRPDAARFPAIVKGKVVTGWEDERWLARTAHARGLVVAHKNAPGLVAALVDTWDLAVVEECFQWAECWRYRPYLDTGRPVLDVEHALAPEAYCDRATAMGIAAIHKHLRLDAHRVTC